MANYQDLPYTYGAANAATGDTTYNDAEAYIVGGQPYTPVGATGIELTPLEGLAVVAAPGGIFAPFLMPPLESLMRDNWLAVLLALLSVWLIGYWIFGRNGHGHHG